MANGRSRWMGSRDLVEVWSNTRMVVLVAISAAIYAAVLIPFKAIPIIPGVTELRPANALPPVTSFLFGPAAAWGTAFGNLIGDFFGTLGPGSLFGFAGNFLLGLIPYKVWRAFARSDMPFQSGKRRLVREAVSFIGVMILSNAACAVVIGWGGQMLGIFPFLPVAPIILGNNTLVNVLFCPFLLAALGPRVKRWGLTHAEILYPNPELNPPGRARLSRLGFVLLAVGAFGGLAAGIGLSLAGARLGVSLPLVPFILAILAGACLL